MNRLTVGLFVFGLCVSGFANADMNPQWDAQWGEMRRGSGIERFGLRDGFSGEQRWESRSWREYHHHHCDTSREVIYRTVVVSPPVVVPEPVVYSRTVVYRSAPVVYRSAPVVVASPVVRSEGVSGAIVGGIAGALIGAQVGKGNGRIAASAIGAATGAVVGDRLQSRIW